MTALLRRRQVCGVNCAEIDIQEANKYGWHTTVHTAYDGYGVGGGFGGGPAGAYTGPRDWTAAEYNPVDSTCIDTSSPFRVAVSFPRDRESGLLARGINVTLSQNGCRLQTRAGEGYATSAADGEPNDGVAQLTAALAAGMTPVISYWSSDDMCVTPRAGEGVGCARSHGSTGTFFNVSACEGRRWGAEAAALALSLAARPPHLSLVSRLSRLSRLSLEVLARRPREGRTRRLRGGRRVAVRRVRRVFRLCAHTARALSRAVAHALRGADRRPLGRAVARAVARAVCCPDDLERADLELRANAHPDGATLARAVTCAVARAVARADCRPYGDTLRCPDA